MEVEVDGRAVAVTHGDRVLFPDIGLTKADLVAYYIRVAPYALPHLRGRPVSLERFPAGIGQAGFFMKERPGHFPDWVHGAEVEVRGEARRRRGATLTMTLVDDAASLAYIVNQGCVTAHVGLVRVDRPDHPDRLVFDLDPGAGGFEVARRLAPDLADRLRADELVPYVKTTGSSGLHVEVPLDAAAPLDDVRRYAELVADEMVDRHADDVTTAFRKAERGGRLFLDVLRNGHGQTEVAAYCVRARAEAPVATPLEWDELGDRRLHAQRFTVANLFRRLGRRPDPWAAFQESSRPLPG